MVALSWREVCHFPSQETRFENVDRQSRLRHFDAGRIERIVTLHRS